MRSSHIIALILLSFFSSRARAEWRPVLPGPFERVVAADRTIAAIRGREVWILGEDGRVLSRIDHSRASSSPTAEPSAKRRAEKILDRLEIPEIDRDTDLTDELLDQESTLAERRSARARRAEIPASVSASPRLAASASAIWLAGNDGVLRVGADGRLAPVLGREFRDAHMAATQDWIAVARGNSIGLFSTGGEPRREFELSQKPTHLAISASGLRMAWATAGMVSWIAPVAARRNLAAVGPVLDLGFCGETLAVAFDTEMVVVPPAGQPETRNNPFHVRRIVCSAHPGLPWLALGDQILASTDAGQNWEALATPPRGALFDIATSAHRLWLATSEGLFTFVHGDTLDAATPSLDHLRPAPLPQGRATWLSWMSWMPSISVRATAAFAPDNHQLQALAFAAFPLDPAPVTAANGVRTTDVDNTQVPTPPPTRQLPHAGALPDPDADCLVLARRKAVELAMSEPERARSYVARAGRAAWLPELRVMVSRRYGRSESVDAAGSSTALASPIGIDTVNDIRYEARATWDLAKLVFAHEELAAQTQALHMAELRRDLESTVNRLYFERRELVLDGSRERSERDNMGLRKSRIEAELDAMSGGAFAVCIAGRPASEAGAR